MARWYCPRARSTVSALPDCLAARRKGTLEALEAVVVALECAPSRAAAAQHLRTDVELPGALRYLTRLERDVYAALVLVKGLQPQSFAGVEATLGAFAVALGLAQCAGQVLLTLRECAARYLAKLPPPLGFNPARSRAGAAGGARQHDSGPDPPHARLDPA